MTSLYPVEIIDNHLVFQYGQQRVVLTPAIAEQLANDLLDKVKVVELLFRSPAFCYFCELPVADCKCVMNMDAEGYFSSSSMQAQQKYIPFILCENCGGAILANEAHNCPHCAGRLKRTK